MLGNLEAAGIGATADSFTTIYDNFSFFYTIFMLCFDAMLYGLLAAYFDKVLPSEYGTQLPWHFPFSFLFGGGGKGAEGGGLSEPLLGDDADKASSVKQEPVSADLMSQISENRSLSIKNLRKVFKTTGEDRIAVNNLSLDMFEGQITVLLGHNGAGKSTTISMLTGLINSTSGDALVMGKKITEMMPEIRTSMGVCPQVRARGAKRRAERARVLGIDVQARRYFMRNIATANSTAVSNAIDNPSFTTRFARQSTTSSSRTSR